MENKATGYIGNNGNLITIRKLPIWYNFLLNFFKKLFGIYNSVELWTEISATHGKPILDTLLVNEETLNKSGDAFLGGKQLTIDLVYAMEMELIFKPLGAACLGDGRNNAAELLSASFNLVH